MASEEERGGIRGHAPTPRGVDYSISPDGTVWLRVESKELLMKLLYECSAHYHRRRDKEKSNAYMAALRKLTDASQ